MANILRMDLYRLVHGKSLWIFLAVIVALAAAGAGTVAYVSSPAFMDSIRAASADSAQIGIDLVGVAHPNGPGASDLAEASDIVAQLAQGMSPEALVGNVFLTGGGLSCLLALFVAIFLSSEFESGFSKNVFSVQPSRLAFLAARSVEIVALSALFTLVAIGATLGTAAVAGLGFAPVQPAGLALWAALVSLTAAGFGLITALAVQLTRKMAASVVVGLVLGAGLAAAAIQGFCLLVPSASFLADCTLTSSMSSLSRGLDASGALDPIHIALVAIGFIAVAVALAGVALQKKDV